MPRALGWSYFLDLSSTNGSWLNGMQVFEPLVTFPIGCFEHLVTFSVEMLVRLAGQPLVGVNFWRRYDALSWKDR